jgi:hypothetical protein
MPLSIYQVPLKRGFIQAEFQPRTNAVIIIYDNGDIQCISPSGEQVWNLSLECKPMTFRINAEGALLAILGEGELVFCDILTRAVRKIEVDEKIQLLDLYNNYAVLGGYQEEITLIKPSGSILKTIPFDYLIRQFKVVPLTDDLLIYNQDRNLICTDMDGKAKWMLEHLMITSEIIVSEKGRRGYFVMDSDLLIQFDIPGEAFFELNCQPPQRLFTLSLDGRFLLILDISNTLQMFDDKTNKIWEYQFEHTIEQIKLSPRGNYFLTIDNDDVLTCYSTTSVKKERVDFIELKEDKRILDREIIWTVKPGRYRPIQQMKLLTVNASGSGLGIIGLDGYVHFYDEGGTRRFDVAFPGFADIIGISDSAEYGYVYGGREILIIDFADKTSHFILFEKSLLGKPLVNYHYKKICGVSKEKELLIYDFKGHLTGKVPVKRDYHGGIACDEHGFVVYNNQELSGISDTGKAIFTYPLYDKISAIFYTDNTLLGSIENLSVFAFDLSSHKGKKRQLRDKKGHIQIVSPNPLFIIDGNKMLYHLDRKLATISTHQIDSSSSLFYIEGSKFYEITRDQFGFYCYDETREMVWRHSSEERIRESALMRNGLVFHTRESVQYIEIKHKESSQKHYSQFLEI